MKAAYSVYLDPAKIQALQELAPGAKISPLLDSALDLALRLLKSGQFRWDEERKCFVLKRDVEVSRAVAV